MPGRVILAEPTGACTILTFTAGHLRLRGNWPGSWKGGDDDVWFRLGPKRLHYFDKETEGRIEEKA